MRECDTYSHDRLHRHGKTDAGSRAAANIGKEMPPWFHNDRQNQSLVVQHLRVWEQEP
jgi:hypothetical protein